MTAETNQPVFDVDAACQVIGSILRIDDLNEFEKYIEHYTEQLRILQQRRMKLHDVSNSPTTGAAARLKAIATIPKIDRAVAMLNRLLSEMDEALKATKRAGEDGDEGDSLADVEISLDVLVKFRIAGKEFIFRKLEF